MNSEQVARELGLKRTGRTWRGPCPLHGGTSFTVSEKDGKPVFYCWSCGKSGQSAILAELKARGLWPEADRTPAEKRDYAKQRRRDEADLRDAKMFADVAHAFAERCLEDLSPCDLQRGSLTRLLMALRSDTGMLGEYRAWRASHPEMTQALVGAGEAHSRRLTVMLEDYLEVTEDAA